MAEHDTSAQPGAAQQTGTANQPGAHDGEDRPRSGSGRGPVWKDVALGLLALVTLLLGAVALRSTGTDLAPEPTDGEAVRVFDLDFDRPNRQWVDVLFDHPLGEGKVGDVVLPPPATLDPTLPGVWRWRDTHALRFEPADGFPAASSFRLALIPDRLLTEGQSFSGDTTLSLTTDPFLVERLELDEEPALDAAAGKNRVIFRGNVHFNYTVNPEQLAGQIRLVDPLTSEPVAVDLETGWWSSVVGFRTRPVEKRPRERQLRLVIDGTLTPAQGTVPLAGGKGYEEWVDLGSSERLAVRSVSAEPGRPDSRVEITLSSPVEPSQVRRFLEVEPLDGAPAARVRLSGARNRVVVSGPLEPGSRYRLRLTGGLPSQEDAVLQEPWSQDLRIPDLPPSLELESQGIFLSRSGERALELESVNVGRADLTVDRVYRNNLFVVFRYMGFSLGDRGWVQQWMDHRVGDRLASETLQLGGSRNHAVTTTVDLDRWVERDAPGLYRLTVRNRSTSQGVQRWLLVTDLGVIAKRGTDGLSVWVQTFDDLAPVAGARVRLISDQNQEIATGVTDTAGRVFFENPLLEAAEGQSPVRRFDRERPYFLTVERGDDFTFLLFDVTRVDTSGLDVGGAALGDRGYRAFLYGERDLYRPGETVQGLGVLRDDRLEPPPTMPVTLRHRDPRGRLRGEVSATTDTAGLAEFSLDVPPWALTGAHDLELLAGGEVVGSYRFQVEEFVPDRIKVEIDTEGETIPGPGDDLAWTVRSNYLFGPPAAELPVETRVRLEDDTFSPEGFPGYQFRNPERSFDPRELMSEDGTLTPQGTAGFTTTLPAGVAVPSTLTAEITARVRETGGRGVTARTRMAVHPYPYYLGLQAPDGYREPGQATEVSWVAVTPDGEPTAAGGLRADFFRERWNTVLRKTPSGSYRYETTRESELVESKPLPGGASEGTVTFTPDRYGAYRVELTDPETAASTAIDFYASGWGFAPWALEDPARVELDLEREEYAPGERAVVQVRSPFPGKLLLTVERGRVLWSRVLTLDGNTARVEVPVTADYRPNAYLTATLVRNAEAVEPGEPGRAFGAVPLAVDRGTNRLALTLDAPETLRPERTLEITVDARPGARVTVAAVDEGILQLIAQETPDPFEFFYRQLALGVETFDLFSLLLPEVEGTTSAGGGVAEAGMAQMVRTEGIRRVEPVAFWSGVRTAGADGRVTQSFELPSFQGALRVMAVALDGRRFGSADTRVRVRDPIVLLPTAPRVLAPEDRVELPVTVRNDTGSAATVTVTVAASGSARVAGAASQEVELENGRETTVYFTGLATPTGKTEGGGGQAVETATFTFTAQGAGVTTRAAESVPVRPALPAEAERTAGSLREPQRVLEVEAPERFRTGTLRRDLHVGPLPLTQFSGHLESLLRYPYGCLEQTVSRAFPLLYLEDLARELQPELLEEEDVTGRVMAGLRRLGDVQLDGGGFGLWPGAETPHPWGSVYATHFLVEAARAGYPVEDFVYRNAVDWLSGEARATPEMGADELTRAAYALWVLSRAETGPGGVSPANTGTMDFLRERHGDALSAMARGLLAAAYASLGDPRAAAELARGIEDVERVNRQTGENFHSTLRDRALLLLALQQATPEDERIPKQVDRLVREAGRIPWWNTQESAFVFLALGQFFREQAAKTPFTGTVWVGEERLGTVGPEATSFPGIEGRAPLRIRLTGADGGDYEAGAAFFDLTVRGIPTREAFQPHTAGLEVERRLLTREGGAVDLTAVDQGDLLVLRTRVRSVSGPVHNVAVQSLLPAGLEVENPRLATTETLPWVDDTSASPAYVDLRDDRILMFLDLPADSWQTTYALVRAVAPGTFALPPVHAEAMYDPALSATGPAGALVVRRR